MSPGSIYTHSSAQVHLALTFKADHRFVRHVVLVTRALLAWSERQHMNALGLKTIPRPRNEPRTHTMRGNFNSVIHVSDRAGAILSRRESESARSIFRQP
jgi:hypothetical protein